MGTGCSLRQQNLSHLHLLTWGVSTGLPSCSLSKLWTRRGLQAAMLWILMLASVTHGGLGHSPLHLHGHVGYHVELHHLPPPPICKLEFEKVTKEFCHLKPKRVCETKTHEYKVVTGHEKGDCKEIEVCAPLHHRRRRSPHGFLHHGHPYHECEKEKKEVCAVVPTVEEKSDEVELCHIEPEKVCEEKEVEVPKHVCEDEDSDAESGGVEAVRKRRGRKGRKGKKGGKRGKKGRKAGRKGKKKGGSEARGKETEKGQRTKT